LLEVAMAEEQHVLAFKKLRRAVRKTLAQEVEDSVYEKIKSLEQQVKVLEFTKEKKNGILETLTKLAKNVAEAHNGKAKARRDAVKELEKFLDKIRPFPDALKKKNIQPVVGSYRAKRAR